MDVNINDENYQVELVDDLEEPVLDRNDSRAYASLAHQLAAETIQTSFRRYKECKVELKMRKRRSAENLVKNLAAHTITDSLRRIASSKSRSRASSAFLQDHDAASIKTTSIQPSNKTNSIRILRITNLAVDNVPNVVWQGTNNLYCSLAMREWTHRTPTVEDQKGSVSWQDRVIDFPLEHENNSNHLQNKSSDILSIVIMHENLVVADKTIGQGEIQLTTLFPDIYVTSNYLSEEPIEYSIIAYEGAKFRNKHRGSIKFTASIVQSEFNPTINTTTVIKPKIPNLKEKEKFEFHMGSSDSASLVTHSIDPYTARDDHSSVCDFSSVQLRNAADLLHTWEVPEEEMPTCMDKKKGSISNTTVGSASHNNRNSKNLSHTAPVNTNPKIPISTATEVPQSTAGIASKTRKLSSTAATTVASIQKQDIATSIQTEPASCSSSSAVQEGRKTKSSKRIPTPPAPSSSSSGITGSTRLRSRRATSTEVSEEVPVANTTTLPAQQARRSSTAEGEKSALSTKSNSFHHPHQRINTNTIPIKSTPTSIATNKTDKVLNNRKYGSLTIDEAFRLAMRKKGAFVKLKSSEFVQLLDILHLPIRSELIQQANSSAISLSNLLTENNKKEALQIAPTSSSSSSTEEEEINLPIIHAMSLAATISFAMRDGQLLQSDTVSTTRFTPETETMVTMTESQSERALQQLIELVEGPYPVVKALILRICGGLSNTIGRFSPALSTTTGSSACRPTSWSAEQVQEFLTAIRVPSSRTEPDLTGDVLMCLDHSALRERFGHNPSVDRTRLSVYLYLLKLLDQWWDRGIRPTDCMEKKPSDTLGVDTSGKIEGKNGAKRSKRRGSKSGRFSHTWGDLSAVIKSWQKFQQQQQQSESGLSYNSGYRRVEDGRAVLSHLLKIDDFQALLEAMTPLNRAFGWGCSLDSLVRFASIIGGMRGYLWVKDVLYEDPEGGQHARGSNYSAISTAAGTHSSSIEDIRSEYSQPDSSGTDEIVRWVVLQKSSASSATELTQLIRLCSELKVVMKYASREDEFRVLIPVSCLRITSVQELKDRKFEAELEGLLLEDLDVGKHIVVASIEALTRTCERFDWWDRPSVTALEAMSGQIGEVVSLAEAQDKRRVGVRMLDSGLCDALPLEALRLCTEPELLQLRAQQQNVSNSVVVEEGREEGDAGEGVSKKAGRKKSRVVASESRKTRLRTLIRNLNINENDTSTAPAATTHIQSKPTIPEKVKHLKSDHPPAPAVLSEIEITTDTANKSILSNLSDESSATEAEEEQEENKKKRKQEFRPISSVNRKKKSFSSKLNLSSPATSPTLNTPMLNKPIAAPPAPAPYASSSPTAKHFSPQKPIIRRTRVKHTTKHPPQTHAESGDEGLGLPQLERQPGKEEEQEEAYIPADYSWLRPSKRNPLSFPTSGADNYDGADDAIDAPPPMHHQDRPTIDNMGSPVGKYPEASKKAPIHVIQQSFDSDHAEYTEGVPRVNTSHIGVNNRQTLGTKSARNNRPQSARSIGKKHNNIPAKTEKVDENNQYLDDSNNNNIDTTTSFGLSGVGYMGGGGLAQHPNLWINEDIPVFSDSEQPKKPVHKQHTLFSKQREARQETQKLFDYHDRALDHTISSPDEGKNKQLLNFMLGNYIHDQQQQKTNNTTTSNTSNMHENRTKKIQQQRPKSANPTSRGISNPQHHNNTTSNNSNTSGNKEEKKELHILNIEGMVPPIVQPSPKIGEHTSTKKPSTHHTDSNTTTTTAKNKKKTREEELQYIASSQSKKEMLLKEKVLMKELKRLQGK